MAQGVEVLRIPRPVAAWFLVRVRKRRKAIRSGLREPKVKFSYWKNRALG